MTSPIAPAPFPAPPVASYAPGSWVPSFQVSSVRLGSPVTSYAPGSDTAAGRRATV